MTQLRLNGVEDPSEVKAAYLEGNGEISVIKRSNGGDQANGLEGARSGRLIARASVATARWHPERAEPRSIGTSGSGNVLGPGGAAPRRAARRDHRGAGGREVFELVEATRLRAIAARKGGAGERVTFDVLPGRCRDARGRRPRVRAVLPADQPRRGARPRPARDPTGASDVGRVRGHAAANGAPPAGRPGCARARPRPSRPHRAPDRGSAAHGPRRAAARRPPPRAPGRSAARAGGRPRHPAPAPRGDLAAVADRGAPAGHADADRRGPDRDGRLRRDAVPARAAAVQPRRHVAARARAARASASSSRPPRPRSCDSARGSAPIATATRP